MRFVVKGCFTSLVAFNPYRRFFIFDDHKPPQLLRELSSVCTSNESREVFVIRDNYARAYSVEKILQPFLWVRGVQWHKDATNFVHTQGGSPIVTRATHVYPNRITLHCFLFNQAIGNPVRIFFKFLIRNRSARPFDSW